MVRNLPAESLRSWANYLDREVKYNKLSCRLNEKSWNFIEPVCRKLDYFRFIGAGLISTGFMTSYFTHYLAPNLFKKRIQRAI